MINNHFSEGASTRGA